MINMRIDTPLLTELIPPQQSFHSTELERYDRDRITARDEPPLKPLPLTANQAETLATREEEQTDTFVQEKFIVPIFQQPSERWSIEAFTFPSADINAPIRVADRQERRSSVLLVNNGATTSSIGPSQTSLVPFLLAGAALKLNSLAPVYANAAAGSMVVIEELTE